MTELPTDAIEECIWPVATAVYGYARASFEDSERAKVQLHALLDEIERLKRELAGHIVAQSLCKNDHCWSYSDNPKQGDKQ